MMTPIERAERGRADADGERYARAMNDPAPDVAAEGVGPHPVLPVGMGQRMRGIDAQRIVAADQIGKQRGQHEQSP